jgi:hypothetical protein
MVALRVLYSISPLSNVRDESSVRSFAWTSRFCQPARAYRRVPDILATLHFVAFARLLLSRTTVPLPHVHPTHNAP